MGTGFDDLSDLSHPKFEPKHLAEGLLSAAQISNRQTLRQAMLNSGFSGISSEWWHFDFGDRTVVRRCYLRIE
jgi:D-alanyl-D-alanine dipeptidase